VPTEEDHQLVAEYEQLMSVAENEPMVTGEPTAQLVVPEALMILESPPRLALPTQPFAAPAPTTEPVAEFAPVAESVAEPEPVAEFAPVSVPEPIAEVEQDEPSVEEPAPFSFEFDLEKVLAQVAINNEGLATPFETDDIDDSVRAAVREALAEIEAATRPPVTSGLSAKAFEIALESAPDTPADIEPAGTPAPFLPQRSLFASRPPQVDEAGETTEVAAAAENELPAPSAQTPGIGLRRLIGGPRKP
jgi:hypothetical protein